MRTGVGRIAGGLCAASLFLAAPAMAHPRVDEARERFNRADLRGALDQLVRAERATDLARADLLALLELRALIHFTLGDSAAMNADLVQLASLDPEHVFGDDVPPDVHEGFARVPHRGERLSVAVTVEARPGGVAVEARVRGDAGGLVRSVRLDARSAGGEWQSVDANTGNVELALPAVTEGAIEYAARAIGPGGAALAENGTRAAPATATVGAGHAVPPDGSSAGEGQDVIGGGNGDGDDHEGGLVWWPYAAAGAGVVAVVIVVALVAGGSSDGGSSSTRFDGPNVMGFP